MTPARLAREREAAARKITARRSAKAARYDSKSVDLGEMPPEGLNCAPTLLDFGDEE